MDDRKTRRASPLTASPSTGARPPILKMVRLVFCGITTVLLLVALFFSAFVLLDSCGLRLI